LKQRQLDDGPSLWRDPSRILAPFLELQSSYGRAIDLSGRFVIASGESAGVDQTYTGFVQGARWFTCHFFGHVAPETIGAWPSDEIRLMRGDALVHSLQVLPGLPSQRGSQCMIANSIERIVNARPGWRTVAELAPAYPSLAARASRSPT